MIKVCQIIHGKPVGGIYTVQKHLYNSFSANDMPIDFHTIILDKRNIEYQDYFKEKGIYIQTKNRYKIFILLRKIIRDYDIVHLHGFTPWLVLLVYLSNKNILFNNHGLIGKGRELSNLEKIKVVFFGFFLRNIAKKIVSVSHFINNKMINDYNVKKEKTAVIYNTTDFHLNKYSIKKYKKITLGYHGRFVSFKRIEMIIDTAKHLSKFLDTKVLLIGKGPKKESISNYAYLNNVTADFINYSTEIKKYIKEIDFLLLLSKHEPFGISALEGIMNGIPVFTLNDSGGVVEIFNDKYNWFVCNRVEEIALKIRIFIENRYYQDLFTDFQEYVSENFSMKKFQKFYFDIYKELNENSL